MRATSRPPVVFHSCTGVQAPAACCTTPVISDGNLFFAGWSPGDPEDKEFQFPKFDQFIKDMDADKDGKLSKELACNPCDKRTRNKDGHQDERDCNDRNRDFIHGFS